MQYVLTQEEYDKITRQQHENRKMPNKEALQNFCTMVADTLPVASGWCKGKPWGCILTREKNYEWYCDDCPAKLVCPYDNKNWSK